MDELLINGMDEKSFLNKYNHEQASVKEVGLIWKDLVELYEEHKRNFLHFNMVAAEEHQLLRDINNAYIVKYRTKDPEHLVDKAIRKKIERGVIITKDNYINEFDDIIGFRILHLFKNNWETIHDYIKNNYELNEAPVVYYRKGDSEEFLGHCKELGIEPKEKKAGYRSIHYVIKKPH